jgi:hypothetical protein
MQHDDRNPCSAPLRHVPESRQPENLAFIPATARYHWPGLRLHRIPHKTIAYLEERQDFQCR